MAIEKHIKDGDNAVKEKDYLEAISKYSAAIKEDAKAFSPYLKRANAYQKLNNYEEAKKDISIAYGIAEEKGRRQDIGLCYFRLGLVYSAEKRFKLALTHFEKAIKYDCTESTVSLWKAKAEYNIKNYPEDDVDDDEDDLLEGLKEDEPVSADAKETGKKSTESAKIEEIKDDAQKSSTNIDVINQQAPLKIKIRDDWYQGPEDVTITIYAKNVKEDKLQINFNPRSVSVAFPSSASSEYSYNLDPLYAEIDVEKSRYKVYGTKIEITLIKKVAKKWNSLESTGEDDDAIVASNTNDNGKNEALSYPSSSKKAVNWANFKINEDEEEEKTSENEFFAKLYKDVDDDTKRAMMKSYVQSNGTILTTNWDEAKSKDFETSPPDGMEAKKWS
ncbi:uncharacterized protein RJT20DRAFT_127361 [Scheffersomyces xylosifermentans]|uniref:uncharacterized protein n=1 Tax=Scheffersomyces xylosifermentans TaxID=1304137 RepID=UPI00315D5D97